MNETPCHCPECDCQYFAEPGSELCYDCGNDDHEDD